MKESDVVRRGTTPAPASRVEETATETMPSHPADQATAPQKSIEPLREAAIPGATIGPKELAEWLRERASEIGHEWAEEIHARGLGQGTEVDRVVEEFVLRLTSFLPWLLGPHSDQFEPLWVRTSELFGTMAAKRGLAAGEVIEEFQILRELVIRTLYRSPPEGGGRRLSLREILRLNRIVDRGVTHASVGHTDAMFFQFFEDTDEPVTMSPPEVAREASAQLDLIREEMELALGRTPSGLLESTTEH